MQHSSLFMIAIASLTACGDSTKSDADFQADVVTGMHDSIGTQLAAIITSAQAIQTAAPSHAWDAAADASAITAMQTAWKATRVAYEQVEGATAPIFPEFDTSMDARYDDFMTLLAPGGDQDLFDNQGVTGMHAIERILYAPTIRQEVIDFEAPLPGYKAAAWPATDAEAVEFKTLLVQKLIDDATTLHTEWVPAAIDIGAAFQGLIGLMNEQKEKVNLAASGEEESRYANVTLFDLRNNLTGTSNVYELFRDWIKSKSGGSDDDTMIEAKFTALSALYAASPGDSLPDVPSDWSSDAPTAANLATPFGMMWETVHEDVDPSASGSVVFEMNDVATKLGLMQFIEGQ